MKTRMKKGMQYIKANGWVMGGALLLPIAVLAIVYGMIGIYPGSDRTIMSSDSFSQLSNFLASYNTMMKGSESIFYSWYVSLGLNYWAFISYYLGGLFTPLVYFFDNSQIPDALYVLTLLKIGSGGLAFSIFSQQTFKLPKWGHLGLSISYALMSFSLAFSIMIMWLDTFTYLPLIVLGIHRLMDKRKPLVLFFSYLLLFVTNFYMAFIVGFFSFLYFFTRLFIKKRELSVKATVGQYLTTSLLAGGTSMPVILPTILDLRNNGEALTALTSLKTEDTGALDLIVKSFVGVYDTTQYGTAPFIFIGLCPLILCLYYFASKGVPRRTKLAYGILMGIVAFSFYFEPLNLFWQGMHAPNMFLFRYSFVFSFLIILMAGYGWEKLQEEKDNDRLLNLVIGLVVVFALVRTLISFGKEYRYITILSFGLTLVFLFLYLFVLRAFLKGTKTRVVALVFLVLVLAESGFNAHQIFIGIRNEWTYPFRNQFLYHYDDLTSLVDQTKEENETFYRMENMNPITKNDSLNYGYGGIAMFSSIRNRNFMSYLNDLGYRSWGTNLQNDYRNNTILMDMVTGIKYNLSKDELMKYEFEPVGESGEYTLYENQYAMPLGVMTDQSLYEADSGKNQTALFNQLADRSNSYFTFIEPELVGKEKVRIEEEDEEIPMITYHNENEKSDEPMILEWEAVIPANKQAYFSLYPLNYDDLKGTTVTIDVNGARQTTRLNMTGQYYNLGNYDKETTVTFTIEIAKAEKAQFLTPDIALLDLDEYTDSAEAILEKGVDFKVEGRRAEANVTATEENDVLFTTIPYDKGWKVYVDGKKAEITPYNDAFLSVELEEGTHEVEFVFLPQGLLLGSGISGVSLLLFGGYLFVLKRRKNDPYYQATAVGKGSNEPVPPKKTMKTEAVEKQAVTISADMQEEKPETIEHLDASQEQSDVSIADEKEVSEEAEVPSLMSSFSFSEEKEDIDFSLHTETKIKGEEHFSSNKE